MPGSAAPVPTAFSVVCLKVDESFRSPPNRNQTFISMINHFGMTLKSGVVETGHVGGALPTSPVKKHRNTTLTASPGPASALRPPRSTQRASPALGGPSG